MKTKGIKSMVALLLGATLMSSCVGSFALFNKLAKWNKRATKSKFINEIIFLVISPAYAFCSAADALVLNSIEFWTGKNPLANRVGKTRNIKGDDGLIYAVSISRMVIRLQSQTVAYSTLLTTSRRIHGT